METQLYFNNYLMQRDKYQLKRTKREPPENHTRTLNTTP